MSPHTTDIGRRSVTVTTESELSSFLHSQQQTTTLWTSKYEGPRKTAEYQDRGLDTKKARTRRVDDGNISYKCG